MLTATFIALSLMTKAESWLNLSCYQFEAVLAGKFQLAMFAELQQSKARRLLT
jgi:hypothetical protein